MPLVSTVVGSNRRLNIELDLQSLLGLHVHSCTHCLRPPASPTPSHLGSFITFAPMRGIYLQLKKGVTLHVLIKNLKIEKDIRQILWPCLVFSHVSLGIFYLILLSGSVTVPLRGWDRGTF
jgi:hypothetical protein